jgi:hypothetical protein
LLAALFLTAGVTLVLVQILIHPAIARPGAVILHPPGVVTIVGAIALAAGALSGDAYTSPAFWAGAAMSIVGHSAWIARLGQEPIAPGARFQRFALLGLFATPSVAVAVFVLGAIVMEGDLAWNAAPLAVPGFIVAGFLAVAVTQILRPAARASE